MAIEEEVLQKIPQPPPKPIIGNALDLNAHARAESMMHLAQKYGPIFQLMTPAGVTVVVSGYQLVNELCDQERFKKRVGASLRIMRDDSSPSLFTSETDDPVWRKAHNILMPNFSLRAMKSYHTMMLDIAVQLMDKWSRQNFDDEVDVPGDMTRLTLDTIGLCGFDYRFNSFYRDEPHPFVRAMTAALTESMTRPARIPVEKQLLFYKEIQFNQNMKYMNSVVNTVIHERRESGQDKNDLLGCMLNQPDKETGEKLDDDNIRAQIITFLVAGHETTSGLLSFAIYFLLKHPLVMQKAREEVDRNFGTDVSILPTYDQVTRLQYISQILKESLRLWPTAPGFALASIKDEEILGDTYKVTKDDAILAFSLMLHRDKSVWGDDAEEFRPERFSPENEAKILPNAYKPFGNGIRACIGRQFALQEATLVLGMLLQRFELVDHTDYHLKLKETLTIKPDHFKIKVKPYEGREIKIMPGQSQQITIQADKHEEQPQPVSTTESRKHNTPLLLLFGSNTGTAEDLAHQIAADGDMKGFATTVAPLDDYTNKLPQKGAVIIVTASYNGQPPDNAVQFCSWLKSGNVASANLQGVKYTVFGCGNTDWADTYQAIPKLIDSALAEFGATRLCPRGEGNVKSDFDGQFQSWYKGLWNTLAERLSLREVMPQDTKKANLYTIELITNEEVRSVLQAAGVRPMEVMANIALTKNEGAFSWERTVNHLEIAVPESIRYVTGDHLGVIAQNDVLVVKRVLKRFGFDEFTKIRISQNSDRKTLLPIGDPITASRLLSLYVELQSVATRSQIATLANYAHDPAEKQSLMAFGNDDELYQAQVLKLRKSVIDLLDEYPSCVLPFSIYLEMLSIMHPRFYSISSSPLKDARHCSITVARVGGPAMSGHGTFKGVCSNFLDDLIAEDDILGFIQKATTPFRLPADPSKPLIMVGPGTGVAPFRAFLQERAVLKEQGVAIGKSMLFFGCRNPQCDFLYEDELKAFERQGITELYAAFSRVDGQPRCYVQNRIREQKDKVWSLIQNGAYIYICGDATRMAPDVQRTFTGIYQEKTHKSEQEAKAWLDELVSQRRYQVDIWEANV
jgi:cytochrome P450 / NADPH-cytochrome P450 reductase